MAYHKGRGKSPGSGRKRGTPNKNKLLRVADVLSEAGKSPVEELLLLIPKLQPHYQAKVWLELLSYCQAKPKEVEVSTSPTPTELSDEAVHYLMNIAEGKAS